MANLGTSTAIGTTATGGTLRKVNLRQMVTGVRSKLQAKEGAREAPLPRPVVSIGSEEVNGEDLVVINIKMFGRPVIVDADGFTIQKDAATGKSDKVLTGEKTLRLRLGDTRSGVPMMQQVLNEDTQEIESDRVTFTVPNPEIPEAEFDAENPDHYLTFAGVIQARAYGKLDKDVVYRERKGKEAGIQAPPGAGNTAVRPEQAALAANQG